MSVMNKLLNKSNSYKYYKSEYEKLSKKEKKYKKEISDLKKELKKTQKDLDKANKKYDKNKDDFYFLKQELIAKDNKIVYLQNQLYE
ncbi:hypothetical protein [Methanobrevibacter sp.]|uniref:hypothetical protein n=1 Tax=Methanobrevibacter sp. TaxID=66852 RepID=UPI0026E09DD2|nr:hypothetical protein [Methanobrevibacter sp.]MDO5859637.1 hypothetical protein [Methanobrevibacter sp.]